jgi:uncharacterized protein (TIGR00251 family)
VGLSPTLLPVLVHPRKTKFGFSHRDEWSGVWHVHVTSAPHDQQANRELLEECRKLFRADVELVRGSSSTKKVLRIGMGKESLEQKLESNRILQTKKRE